MNFNFGYAIEKFTEANFKNFWNVDGRVSRRDYWHYFAIYFLIAVAIGVVNGIIARLPGIGGILSMVISLGTLILVPAAIGQAVRRMHDIGKPWWYSLIPLYNLYLLCQPGDKGANVYGEDPLGNTADTFA